MPATSRVIPANEYRRERWRNQLGWTREICRNGDGNAWDWRLSIAEIEQDAAFSCFPGIDSHVGDPDFTQSNCSARRGVAVHTR